VGENQLMVNKKFKGLVYFVIDILGLQFLCHEVRDDGVHPEVQLLDGLLTILSTSLSTL
jgi:hypothetical protein